MEFSCSVGWISGSGGFVRNVIEVGWNRVGVRSGSAIASARWSMVAAVMGVFIGVDRREWTDDGAAERLTEVVGGLSKWKSGFMASIRSD